MRRLPGQTDLTCRPSLNPDHESERAELERLTAEFLAKGGQITRLDPDERKLPSRKLTNEERLLMMKRSKV